MSVTLTGVGGLFTRLGVIFNGIKSANLYAGATDIALGGSKALGVTYTDILAQYASTLQPDVTNLFPTIDAQRQSLSTVKTYLAQLAQQTVIDQVHADAVLTDHSLKGALQELIRQMIGSGTLWNADNDVDAPTVSATATASTTPANTGTGKVAVSVIGGDGRTLENCLGETIEVRVTTDVAGGATARSETVTISGEFPQSDPLAYDWPQGSGSSKQLTVCDAGLDNLAGTNMLTNGDFDSFTSNTPDNWTVLVGVAGTDIFKEVSVVYRSSAAALAFTGTGGTPLSSIAQTLNSSTTAPLKPNTVYAFGCLARKTAGAVAGALQFRLLDSTDTVVNDDASTPNTTTIANGTLTTAYAWQTGFFRTPKTVVPGVTVLKVSVRISTAVTNAETIYVDDLAMVEATQVYDGGPYIAVFAGGVNWLLGDLVNVAVTTNRAGEFQEWFDRVFGMKALGLQLPSDTAYAETISDTLITPVSLRANLVDWVDVIAGFVPLDLQTQRDGQWSNLPEGKHMTIIFYKGTGTDGDDPIITLQQATDVAGAGAKALNFTDIWRKQGALVADDPDFTHTVQAAANTYTNTDGHQQAIWILEIPASTLDLAGGFNWVRLTLNDTGNNPQLGCVLYAVYTP